jgi:hypothetical protein
VNFVVKMMGFFSSFIRRENDGYYFGCESSRENDGILLFCRENDGILLWM